MSLYTKLAQHGLIYPYGRSSESIFLSLPFKLKDSDILYSIYKISSNGTVSLIPEDIHSGTFSKDELTRTIEGLIEGLEYVVIGEYKSLIGLPLGGNINYVDSYGDLHPELIEGIEKSFEDGYVLGPVKYYFVDRSFVHDMILEKDTASPTPTDHIEYLKMKFPKYIVKGDDGNYYSRFFSLKKKGVIIDEFCRFEEVNDNANKIMVSKEYGSLYFSREEFGEIELIDNHITHNEIITRIRII